MGAFALTVWGGIDLYRFALQVETGRAPSFAKPLSPEGFLPIGSLMSFKLWVTTGFIDPVHPAGLVLFATALALSLLLKKSFCGWICPVGTLSELLGTAGRRVAGRLLPCRAGSTCRCARSSTRCSASSCGSSS